MTLLAIRYYPDPVLTQPSEKVTDFGPETQRFFDDLVHTMMVRDGVGLAAPQVGVSRRIIAAAPSPRRESVEIFVNPVITEKEGSDVAEEGCLSFPGLYVPILRARKIRLTYQDRNGAEKLVEVRDFFARVLQHEMDHLDGILMIDRVDFNKRQELLSRYGGVC
jgi:peptide deformylase